ncbi:mannosyltransferase [Burkholderia mayonis]|uniref:Mannosyltransferase n=1 Tax=Burkholderia mayonis TaxID=1385591 RepID=A0A1B4FZJ9_9BURK|nr:mannosyltransferase [Burkholderia mayonis]AOJ09089.1 mannosyltransferase [Burkholderia mayonis]KVE55833.1 mannosyltransferase [Burkholderia mayonis]
MKSQPKVLVTTYHSAFLVKGGGEFEIVSLVDSLKKQGYIADIYGPFSQSIDNYDVVLHFSVHGGGLDLLRSISAAGKPIVLWPNLWVAPKHPPPADMIAEHIRLAKFIVFKSIAEKVHFCTFFPTPEDKIRFVPAGVDEIFVKPAPPDLFRTMYGLGRYAIWFGVIEPNKNQLAAARALHDAGMPLVFVGRYRDRAYYDACRRTAPEGSVFIDALPYRSEIMRAALQEASCYIEVSKEPPGLSAIAAGLAGCRLVLSESAWGREHFDGYAQFVDPDSDESIRTGVAKCLQETPRVDALRTHLHKHGLPGAIAPLLDVFDEAAGEL